MLHLQSQSIQDKDVLELFKETENRIRSMALVHEKLYQGKDLSRVDLKDYFKDLLDLIARSYKDVSQGITFDMEMDSVPTTIDHAIPCGLIINELVSNCFKHAFTQEKNGEIRIGLKQGDDGDIEITVADNGIGMPEGFNLREVDSFGLESAVALTEHQLLGEIDLITDKGTEFHIRFRATGYEERV
jgi:two-component sensor histidine kinase